MKKLFITIILGVLMLSCSNIKDEKIIKIEKVEISYSMVEQAIALDDAISLKLFLENKFNPNYRSADGETLLMKIVKNNSLKCLKEIINYGVELEMETPLEKMKNITSYKETKRAIDFVRSKKALEILIEAGSNINYINNKGIPLIINFIKIKSDSYVKELILNEVDLNMADSDQWTALMWSTSKRNKELVKLILENKVDINKIDDRKNYAIYYAYDEDIIIMLLTKNLNLNYKNKDGENILGEVYLRSISNSYYDAVKKIIEIGSDKNYSSYGDEPIKIARKNKDEKMIELLLKLGVEDDEKN